MKTVQGREVTRVHQIEITTQCNLRCVYCPHPKMQRPKVDMDIATFEAALNWVRYYKDHPSGTQDSLSLTGIGESLMHPHFIAMCKMARDTLPNEFIHLSTNGLLVTKELCSELSKLNIKLDISLHRPEKAGPAIALAREYGIMHDSNPGASMASIDWAGQVDWKVTSESFTCQYLYQGWGIVLVDGSITTCCIDAENLGVVGHVHNNPGPIFLKPFSLCKSCHLKVPPGMEAY